MCVGQPSSPEDSQHPLGHPLRNAECFHQRSQQYAERDEQPDLGHHRAEALDHLGRRTGESLPGRDSQISAAQDQRDHRLDLEGHDDGNHSDNADGDVDQRH